ncbi:hypothetical protein KJ733_01955, partial [Patescibacteria group bacterium]|nr:hypothetical protein [Patescibacteria group bacterium]
MGGTNTTPILAAHFAKQNTKFGGGKKLEWKARAGKNSFPPTPFLFARPSDWILKFGIRIFVKKCSNFVQKTPPSFTFSEIERCCLGAKRLGMVFFRNFKGIFEIQKQSAVGNAEVRTNLFEKIPNPFGIFLLSVFFGLV